MGQLMNLRDSLEKRGCVYRETKVVINRASRRALGIRNISWGAYVIAL